MNKKRVIPGSAGGYNVQDFDPSVEGDWVTQCWHEKQSGAFQCKREGHEKARADEQRLK